MSRLSDKDRHEIKQGFMRLFELKVNGEVTGTEELERKQLMLRSLNEKESVANDEESKSSETEMMNPLCINSVLKISFICFWLIDP